MGEAVGGPISEPRGHLFAKNAGCCLRGVLYDCRRGVIRAAGQKSASAVRFAAAQFMLKGDADVLTDREFPICGMGADLCPKLGRGSKADCQIAVAWPILMHPIPTNARRRGPDRTA